MSDHHSKGKSKKDDKKGKRPFADTDYPYPDRMPKKEYERALLDLQIELVKAQNSFKETGKRVVVLFEGRDAAGKGGSIKRFTEHLNPRSARVVALNKPDETEIGQWYFQRYIVHLPTKGELVFFDRSWYNRAGVEPVMGFCSPAQYREFLRQVPGYEAALVKDGITLIKLWFAVQREEQKKRFEARKTDPLKQWKLSPMDIASMGKWDEYSIARDRMFFMTHSMEAPWTVVLSDCKRRARVNAIRHVLSRLDYEGKDEKVVGKPDPLIVQTPEAADPSEDSFEAIFGRG